MPPVAASARPAPANVAGYPWSAERKTSKGAPLSICEKKFPDDPYTASTRTPACSCSTAAMISGSEYRRLAAAAIRSVASLLVLARPHDTANDKTAHKRAMDHAPRTMERRAATTP